MNFTRAILHKMNALDLNCKNREVLVRMLIHSLNFDPLRESFLAIRENYSVAPGLFCAIERAVGAGDEQCRGFL